MEKDDVLNLDAHDGEYEPEDKADEEHVDDRRDRVHQSVHHNLIVTVISACGDDDHHFVYEGDDQQYEGDDQQYEDDDNRCEDDDNRCEDDDNC